MAGGRQKLITDVEVNSTDAVRGLDKLGDSADKASVDVEALAKELKQSEKAMETAGDTGKREANKLSDAYDNTKDSGIGAASAIGEAFGSGGGAADAVGSMGEVVESVAESFGPLGGVVALVGGAVLGMFAASKEAAEKAKQAAIDFTDALIAGGGQLEKADMAERTREWFEANQDLVDSVEELAGPTGLQNLHKAINGNSSAASQLLQVLGAQNDMDEEIIRTTNEKIYAGQQLTKAEENARANAQARIDTYKQLTPELEKASKAAQVGADHFNQLATATQSAGKHAANYKAPPVTVRPGESIRTGGKNSAAGGPVTAGQAYTVGEYGKETFVPNVSGTIVPNGGGTGSVVTIHQTVVTNDPMRVAQRTAEALRRQKFRAG